MTRKYVWIVTKLTADEKAVRVVSRLATQAEAEARSKFPGGNYEGPVPADMYPLGTRI